MSWLLAAISLWGMLDNQLVEYQAYGIWDWSGSQTFLRAEERGLLVHIENPVEMDFTADVLLDGVWVQGLNVPNNGFASTMLSWGQLPPSGTITVRFVYAGVTVTVIDGSYQQVP